MALENCPECRQSVSTSARACPHCGFPLASGVKSESSPPPKRAVAPRTKGSLPPRPHSSSPSAKTTKGPLVLVLSLVLLLALAGAGYWAYSYGLSSNISPGTSNDQALAPAAQPTAQAPAPKTHDKNTPLSFDDLRAISLNGLDKTGYSFEEISLLSSAHKLRNIEKCIVKFEHWMYDGPPEILWRDNYYKREGYILLLAAKGNKVIGLTTQCSINFAHPGYQFVDPGKGRDPDYVAGVIALHKPGDPTGTNRDFYMVKHEMNKAHPKVKEPSGRFLSEFLPAMGIKAEFWKQLMESGDQVYFKPVGRNDLAFVVFEQKKMLGIESIAEKGEVKITGVVSEMPAARAGLKVSDILVSIHGHRILTLKDIDSALDACPYDEKLKILVKRNGVEQVKYAFIQHPGNFITQGLVATLDLQEPEQIISNLLQELDKLGGLLKRDLLVQCHVCDAMVQKAKLEKPPTATDTIMQLLPVAGGLIGADMVLKIGKAIRVYEAFAVGYKTITTLTSEVGDLVAFFKNQMSIGAPLILDPASAEVISGDSFKARDHPGAIRTFHLAYLKSNSDSGQELLRGIFAIAAENKCLLVAIPDGEDHKGRTHCHILIVRPEQVSGSPSLASLSSAVMEGYLNLVLIMKGAAIAYDHNVSDGRYTRFLLRAFKELERPGY